MYFLRWSWSFHSIGFYVMGHLHCLSWNQIRVPGFRMQRLSLGLQYVSVQCHISTHYNGMLTENILNVSAVIFIFIVT